MFAYGATGVLLLARATVWHVHRRVLPALRGVCKKYRYKIRHWLTALAGSGKTHTMIGDEQAGPGVMVLAMRDLFAKIKEIQADKSVSLKISYLEVYNEQINDLFVDSSKNLPLREVS